jgi:salicylate hydroxylase
MKSDMVSGADGIKSVLRPRIIGKYEYTTARPSGQSAFRFTLQKSYIEESLAYLPAMIDSNEPVTLTVILALDGSKRTMVAYPCRNMELLNFVCIVRDKDLANETTESWTAEGDKEELLALFSGFPGWALELVR